MPRLLDTPLAGFDVRAERSRAALIIVHGLAGYAGRYGPIVVALAGLNPGGSLRGAITSSCSLLVRDVRCAGPCKVQG